MYIYVTLQKNVLHVVDFILQMSSILNNNLYFQYFSCYSNQSKEAFADWTRHDDAQDHFCELDGEDY